MKIDDVMKKIFQERKFKDGMNANNKSFLTFGGCSVVYIAVSSHPQILTETFWTHHFCVRKTSQFTQLFCNIK